MSASEALRRGVLRLHSAATGRNILACLESLERTQWLDAEALRALQREKLLRLLENAYQFVPYYRRVFDQVGFHPDDMRRDPACFQRLPILTKSIIRENYQELQTTDPVLRKQLSRVTTSGSTGQPLIFLQDHAYRDNVTADIQRHLEWAGWQMGALHAYIWGANFEETTAHALRTRLIDWEWNRFLANGFTFTEANIEKFAERVYREKPRVLFGYASCIHRFAQYVRRSKYQGITFDGIITSAEVLHEVVRQVIEETFQCPVLNRYGSKELGGIACECRERNGLHISAENNWVEILNDGEPALPGEVGSLIVTNLNNWGMPFIRYSIGDEAAWGSTEKCRCGRSSPRLQTVQGRLVDQFVTRDGRASWAGFAGDGYSSLLAQPYIKQFQIIQESLDQITVRLVKDGEIPISLLARLEKTLKTAFGEDVDIEFEFPEEIPVLPSGKHQYAITRVKQPQLSAHQETLAEITK